MLDRVVAISLVAALLFGFPYLSSRDPTIRTGPFPKSRPLYYLQVVFVLGMLGVVAFVADFVGGRWALERLTSVPSTVSLLSWSVLTLGLMLGLSMEIARVMRRTGLRETRFTQWLLPRTPLERVCWVPVSVGAGVFEEFVYRGACHGVILQETGSSAVALLVTSVGFGLAHGYQASHGAMRSGALAVVLTLPVAMTGSLLPGIVAHTVFDLIGGFSSIGDGPFEPEDPEGPAA